MNQLVRAVATGSPRTSPSQVKRCAATCPGSIVPIGDSIGAVATDTSWVLRISGSKSKPSASAIISIDCEKPSVSSINIGLVFACSGVFPNSMM